MNKGFKGLLVAVVAVGSAVATEQKTSFNTRICRDSSAAYTSVSKFIQNKNDKEIGGNLVATGFYGRSTNGDDFAKAFGANDKGEIIVYKDSTTNLNANKCGVSSDLLLHTVGGNSAIEGKAKFAPKQTVYGVRLDYVQDLSKWLDGLYVGANAAVVNYTNDVNFKVENGVAQKETRNSTLQDLMSGKKVERDSVRNEQAALKHAKLCSNDKTGLTDVKAYVGYNILEGQKYHAGVKAGVRLPTSPKPNADYLWAARTDEHKWGIFGGADASAMLWQDENQNLKVSGSVEYEYLFSGDEKRTLGLSKLGYTDGSVVQTLVNPVWSQYYLVGTKGAKGLQPLANVSTFDVEVQAVSQIEGILAATYTNNGFSIDLGYCLNWRQAEEIELEKGCCAAWNKKQYAVSNVAYDATATFGDADTLTGNANGYIKAEDLNLKGAATDAIVTHKVFTGVNYTTKWEYPVMVGAGVAYEIPSEKKEALEGYSIWAKAGVSF